MDENISNLIERIGNKKLSDSDKALINHYLNCAAQNIIKLDNGLNKNLYTKEQYIHIDNKIPYTVFEKLVNYKIDMFYSDIL